MNDHAKLVLSRYMLGDGTWRGHKFASKFPHKEGAVCHLFYVLRPNSSVWGAGSNYGKHVLVTSYCGRWTSQIGNLRDRAWPKSRLCKNCLRVLGGLAL